MANPHDDWLGLDQRRVNHPVVRLSNNQVIGFVEIGRDANPLLLDQTNREGLIHNPAFDDLRRLVHFFFLEIENHRQTIRHPVTWPGRCESVNQSRGPLPALEQVAAGLPPKDAARVRKAGAEMQAHLAQLQEQHRRTLESYAELAASGQVLLGVESEFRAALAIIREALAVPHEGNGKQLPAQDNSDIIRATVALLERRLSDLHSIAIQGERRRTVDLDVEIRAALAMVEERARRHGIPLVVKSPPKKMLARAEIRPEKRAPHPPAPFRQLRSAFSEGEGSSGRDQGLGPGAASGVRLFGQRAEHTPGSSRGGVFAALYHAHRAAWDGADHCAGDLSLSGGRGQRCRGRERRHDGAGGIAAQTARATPHNAT